MRTALLLLLLVFTAPTAYTQAIPPVPAEVVSVQTGGYWEADGRRGSYRVVVANRGYEHVSSVVEVQWLAEASSNTESSSVVAVRAIQEVGQSFSVGARLQPKNMNSARLVLDGTNSIGGSKRRWVLELGAPGVYRALKNAP